MEYTVPLYCKLFFLCQSEIIEFKTSADAFSVKECALEYPTTTVLKLKRY